MPTLEQKKRLLKAKIAVALHDELGRTPKSEEIDQVFLLTRQTERISRCRLTFEIRHGGRVGMTNQNIMERTASLCLLPIPAAGSTQSRPNQDLVGNWCRDAAPSPAVT